MHGGIYNILLSMQDFVGNPVSTATNYMIEHDVETETPVFSEPSKNRIKVAFVIQFTLPENATAGTVKVTSPKAGPWVQSTYVAQKYIPEVLSSTFKQEGGLAGSKAVPSKSK